MLHCVRTPRSTRFFFFFLYDDKCKFEEFFSQACPLNTDPFHCRTARRRARSLACMLAAGQYAGGIVTVLYVHNRSPQSVKKGRIWVAQGSVTAVGVFGLPRHIVVLHCFFLYIFVWVICRAIQYICMQN